MPAALPRAQLPSAAPRLPMAGRAVPAALRGRQPGPRPSCPRGAEAAGVGARTARPRLPRQEASGRAAGGSGNGAFVISVLNEAGGARPTRAAAGKGLKGSARLQRGECCAPLCPRLWDPGSARPCGSVPSAGLGLRAARELRGRTTQRELCWSCVLQIPAPCFSYRAPERETREQDEQNRRRKDLPLNNMPPELLHGDRGIR